MCWFSMSTVFNGWTKKRISRYKRDTFFDVARIINYHHPKVVFLENVKNLKNHDHGKTFATIKQVLEELGYSVYSQILNAKDFGLPQNRERIFIVAFLGKTNFVFPTKSGIQTSVGQILDSNVEKKYTISDRLWAGHQRRKEEHRKKGNGFGYSIFNANSYYTSTLSARYYKDGSEILIEQEGKNPRKLTPREALRLQGFPESFIIPVSDNQAYKQLGNSVAVNVIKAIAFQMINSLVTLNERSASKIAHINVEHFKESVVSLNN